jgi:hypothetical protein
LRFTIYPRTFSGASGVMRHPDVPFASAQPIQQERHPMRTLRHLKRVSVLVCLAAFLACTGEPADTTDTSAVSATTAEPAGPVEASGPAADARPNPATAAAKGQDPNIRPTAGTNVSGATVTAAVPAHKQAAGAASKGAATCLVRFDNRTDLYIATHVDGNSAGTLGPWGDVYAYAIAGPTRLYARADFTDGSVTTWGPTMVDCPAGGSYHWRLYP